MRDYGTTDNHLIRIFEMTGTKRFALFSWQE